MRARFSVRRVGVGAWLAGSLLLAGAVAAGSDAGASRAELERWFATLRATHDMGAAQRWEYSFEAADGRALEALSVALVRDGYEIQQLGTLERPALRMTKIELHTPLTLARRNQSLQQAARTHRARYLGVDVARHE